ncbi:hypothetical protein [Sphingomonas profundi]|uniref:hypothetical protein n=1 Tax=Alterirhizorhabdus profundi TaxID=2681549 RepID=UPI0012E874E9|nr:hypothetical protein [Sphingomonas profundi]
MTIAVMIVLVFAISISIAIPMTISENRRHKARLKAAREQISESFGSGDYYLNAETMDRVGVNWETKKIMIGCGLGSTYLMDFRQLRQVALDVNGITVETTNGVIKTRRGSQMIGGAAGGLLLGPAGLLVGGLSAGSRTSSKTIEVEKVRSVSLNVEIRDRTKPIHTITFFNAGATEGIDKASPLITSILEQARHYNALLEQIVENNEMSPEVLDMVGATVIPFLANLLDTEDEPSSSSSIASSRKELEKQKSELAAWIAARKA